MNLFDIRQELVDTIEYGVDTDTGEILEGQELKDKVDALQMKLDDKLENIACFIKNLETDAKALKEEKDNFAKRQKQTENKINWLKTYLSNFMLGNDISGFSTNKCKVSFRKSASVQISDVNNIPAQFKKIKTEETVDKAGLKEWLKKNECLGAEIIESQNIQIK